MIYCRWAGNSNIFVYQSTDGGFYCRACTLFTRKLHTGSESYRVESRGLMIKHLIAHRAVGDKVPEEVLTLLRSEIEQQKKVIMDNYNSIVIGMPFSPSLPADGKQQCANCERDVAINPTNIPRIKKDQITILCIACGTKLYQQLDERDKVEFLNKRMEKIIFATQLN